MRLDRFLKADTCLRWLEALQIIDKTSAPERQWRAAVAGDLLHEMATPGKRQGDRVRCRVLIGVLSGRLLTEQK